MLSRCPLRASRRAAAGSYLLVGAFQPQQTGNPLVTDLLEWVNDGNTLIVVNNIEAWAAHLAQKEAVDYRGSKVPGTSVLPRTTGAGSDCVYRTGKRSWAAWPTIKKKCTAP